MFSKNKIIKILNIEGMSCMHCAKKVENALKEIKEVKAVKVNLENKTAEVVLKENISQEILNQAIENAGYKVKN